MKLIFDSESTKSQDITLDPKSILGQLIDARVLDEVALMGPNGHNAEANTPPVVLRLREGCDRHFALLLFPEELIQLGQELTTLGKITRALSEIYSQTQEKTHERAI